MPDRTAPHAVLVEGVECAGKTTLIRALRERLDWDCKALSHRPAHQFDRFMGEYLLGRDVVFNRGHYRTFNSLPVNSSARMAPTPAEGSVERMVMGWM